MDRYFLDESGHGGDLASATALDFSRQPVLALACIGVANEAALAGELDALKTRHGCGAEELKSNALGGRLAAVAADLTGWLLRHDCPIFIELVEKRFFVSIHVVNHLLCGPYGLEDVDQPSRSAVTELLDRASFDVVLLAYLDACRS